MEPEPINAAVRKHGITAHGEHRHIARTLHDWLDRFNRELFGGMLPLPFLLIERLPSGWAGCYRSGRNGPGTRSEIRLDDRCIERPLYEVLATLLHEMVHEWQDLYGTPGMGTYHNREFTGKCRALGIPCNGGYASASLGYTDPFVGLLRRHGVEVGTQREGGSPASPPRAPR